MDDQRLLEIVKERFPWLHEVYKEVETIQKGSGYGEMSIGVTNGLVDRFQTTVKKIYKKRENNNL